MLLFCFREVLKRTCAVNVQSLCLHFSDVLGHVKLSGGKEWLKTLDRAETEPRPDIDCSGLKSTNHLVYLEIVLSNSLQYHQCLVVPISVLWNRISYTGQTAASEQVSKMLNWGNFTRKTTNCKVVNIHNVWCVKLVISSKVLLKP